MKYLCTGCFVFIFLLQTEANSQTKEAPEIANVLESKAIDALTKTLPGATYDIKLNLNESGLKILAEMSVAFDSSKTRIKVRHKYANGKSTTFSDWQGPNYAILKDDVVLTRLGLLERSTIIEKQDLYPDLYASKRAFWPQFVGATTEGVWMMPDKNPRGFLESKDRIATNVTDEKLNGVETQRVDYNIKPYGTMSVWYAVKMNGLIGKISTKGASPTIESISETTIQNKEWAKGIWFPENILTIRNIDGKESKRETVQIESLVVGIPDEKMFGLAGLELADGDVVDDSSTGETKYYRWLDGEMVEMTPKDIEMANWQPLEANSDTSLESGLDQSQHDTNSQLLLIATVIFLIVITIWFVISKKSQTKNK